jgi:hypothetical protein
MGGNRSLSKCGLTRGYDDSPGVRREATLSAGEILDAVPTPVQSGMRTGPPK